MLLHIGCGITVPISGYLTTSAVAGIKLHTTDCWKGRIRQTNRRRTTAISRKPHFQRQRADVFPSCLLVQEGKSSVSVFWTPANLYDIINILLLTNLLLLQHNFRIVFRDIWRNLKYKYFISRTFCYHGIIFGSFSGTLVQFDNKITKQHDKLTQDIQFPLLKCKSLKTPRTKNKNLINICL